jgi:hypothetical protein
MGDDGGVTDAQSKTFGDDMSGSVSRVPLAIAGPVN